MRYTILNTSDVCYSLYREIYSLSQTPANDVIYYKASTPRYLLVLYRLYRYSHKLSLFSRNKTPNQYPINQCEPIKCETYTVGTYILQTTIK